MKKLYEINKRSEGRPFDSKYIFNEKLKPNNPFVYFIENKLKFKGMRKKASKYDWKTVIDETLKVYGEINEN